jgi:hypothetical protein
VVAHVADAVSKVAKLLAACSRCSLSVICRPLFEICCCPHQVVAHVADAVSKGAKLLAGGSVPQLPEPLTGGNFYSPTVLAEATIDM